MMGNQRRASLCLANAGGSRITLERDSKRVGNAGEHIDYALLLDGLKAEREQGITIDVAYRYFSTNGRKFIIADTPGPGK